MIFSSNKRNPWTWVPSLYFAEGIPYILVTYISVVMYKGMGISNTDIALYTSWLYLPWVIKPLWSPVVDLLKTKRYWIILMQLLIGAGLAGIAFSVPINNFFQYTLMFFWLLAFSSATHDIAADGFYMLGLSDHNQSKFVGIRSTFYRLSMIFGQGVLVIIAGNLEEAYGIVYSWNFTLYLVAGLYVLFFLYHFFILPKPSADKPVIRTSDFWKDFFNTFILFFKKKNILAVLAFILLYRLGEAQLL
jgi:PAT family beta-lactamase induction signal transducer AmpG